MPKLRSKKLTRKQSLKKHNKTFHKKSRGGDFTSMLRGSSLGRTVLNASNVSGNSIQTIQNKLNTILIHNRIPYLFTDGTLATQYGPFSATNIPTELNLGRGDTLPKVKYANTTGYNDRYANLQVRPDIALQSLATTGFSAYPQGQISNPQRIQTQPANLQIVQGVRAPAPFVQKPFETTAFYPSML
jgi:hypothetical protein